MLSIILCIGLLLSWVGERIVDSTTMRSILSGGGAALVLAALVLRVAKNRSAAGTAKVHSALALLHGIALLSLVLYGLQSDLFTKLTGASLESSAPILATALSVLWPAFLAVSLLPTLLIELSFAAMAKSPTLEDGRIREALYAGLGLAFVLIFAGATQYVATERDAKADFSYFRMAKPGDATTKLIASLDQPLDIFLFYPPASDTAELVQGFFDDLKTQTSQLKVTRLDYALDPLKAKELGVGGNGVIVFRKGARKESLFVAAEVEKARTQLRSLDAEVQKRVLQVAKTKRTIYMTGGHGERTQEPNATTPRSTVELLWKALQEQNFDVRVLTSAEGLGQEVPKDAAAVFVIGPTRDFSEPEAATLAAYEKRGGRVFIALDPEPGVAFDGLLTPLGLKMTTEPLAQETSVYNVKPPPSQADRVNIATRSYSSHPSVTNLSRAQAAILVVGAGGLDELPQHPADIVVDFAVRSSPMAWNDVSRNFQFDQADKETRKSWGLMGAISRRTPSNKPEEELRALVLGDSDGIADDVLAQLPGNQYLVLDGLKWLLGDEQLSGTTNTELDVPLSRSRQQDSLWFYGTTFAAPLLVVGLGLLTRRRAKKPNTVVTPKEAHS